MYRVLRNFVWVWMPYATRTDTLCDSTVATPISGHPSHVVVTRVVYYTRSIIATFVWAVGCYNLPSAGSPDADYSAFDE